MFGYTGKQLKKFFVAGAGFVATVLATVLAIGPEVIPEGGLVWVHIVLALATSYGVFKVTNTPPGPTPPVG